MEKLIYFNDMFYPTHPYIDHKLYYELVNMGFDVQYVVYDNDTRITHDSLKEEYNNLNLLKIKTEVDILKHLGPKNMLLTRFSHKYGMGKVSAQMAGMVNSKRARVFVYDIASIDSQFRCIRANYFAAMGNTTRKIILKKFPKSYDQIFVTGTIHQDDAPNTVVDKKQFMLDYGLNPNKKLIVLTAANPSETGHHPEVPKEYTDIINIIQKQCNNMYEIIVSAHPNEHMHKYPLSPSIIYKQTSYGSKRSWQSWGIEGLKVVKAEEKYRAFAAADVVVNARSSVAMEALLLYTPVINVNSFKYIINWPIVNDPGVMKTIDIKDLKNTLVNSLYSIDKNKCNKYISNHFHANDGMAYKRIADKIKQVF